MASKGDVEHTEDGRYIVVGGRRWRATDPSIPEKLRGELVCELMAARRAVRDAGDAARFRVQDAKVALGERGDPWWEDPTDIGLRRRLAAAMCVLLRHRAPESTICPSDAARVVGGTGWRDRMDDARSVAAELQVVGTIRIQQRHRDVDPSDVIGPIRLARGPEFES